MGAVLVGFSAYRIIRRVRVHDPAWAVYLSPADKYLQAHPSTVKGTKSSMEKGSAGITAAF